jgi:hypothetical protein
MKLIQLLEMAAPTEAQRNINYYHGTSSEIIGQKILHDGYIKPRDPLFDKLGRKRQGHATTSYEGQTYISPRIDFVIAYVLGGNFPGDDLFETDPNWRNKLKTDPFGYLFVIPGKNFVDILPDEDSVGELLYILNRIIKLHKGALSYDEQWLIDLAKRILTPQRLWKVNDGEYDDWAMAGKQILRYLGNDTMSHRRLFDLLQKYEDSRSVYGLSHTGKVEWREAYRFPKIKTKLLKPDCSNFFDLAERIA